MLVILHGWSDSYSSFRDLAKRLAKRLAFRKSESDRAQLGALPTLCPWA